MSVREREREREWRGVGASDNEIDINRDAEPRYRHWLKERTTRTGKYLYWDEAVYGGAEQIGISPVTASRYLKKAISPQGDFTCVKITEDGRSKRQILWKHSHLSNPKKLDPSISTGNNVDPLRRQA